MKITRVSQLTGFEHTLDIDVTPEQIVRWQAENLMVQQAFPHLSAAHREFLLTGATPEEWDYYIKPSDND